MDSSGRRSLMAISVAPFLADFAGVARRAGHFNGAAAADDLDGRIEAARAEGRRAGEAAALARFEVELADERRRSEAELAAARSRWAAEEGARFVEELRALEARLAEGVAEVLAPLLPELARARIVDDLAATMKTLLKPGGVSALQVSGPVDLLDALREKLGDTGSAIEYWPAGGPDIRVTADHTLIETGFGAWLDRLRGLIA
jgi:hypothetical protein